MPTKAIAQGKDYLTRLFARDLVEKLYPQNSFITQSVNDTSFVNGDEVVLPHAGALPTVKQDRTGKGTAVKRDDTFIKYTLHEFTTDPNWIQFSEKLLANYDKRASILYNHRMVLEDTLARFIASQWAKADITNPSKTTGTSRAPSAGKGNAKALTLEDLLSIQERMNKDDIPQEGRFALITASMLRDLLKIKEVQSLDFNNKKPLVNGSVGSFLGITFYIRSSANVFTKTGATVRGINDTVQDTDTAGALFWHRAFVRKAQGSVKVFLENDKVEYYGDLMSCLVRCGATQSRKDGKGVYNLIEDKS